MSYRLAEWKGTGSRKVDMVVDAYAGPAEIGECVQLSTLSEEGNVCYVQLNKIDIENLLTAIPDGMLPVLFLRRTAKNAMRIFAHWNNGVEEVGTTGTTLKKAMEECDKGEYDKWIL